MKTFLTLVTLTLCVTFGIYFYPNYSSWIKQKISEFRKHQKDKVKTANFEFIEVQPDNPTNSEVEVLNRWLKDNRGQKIAAFTQVGLGYLLLTEEGDNSRQLFAALNCGSRDSWTADNGFGVADLQRQFQLTWPASKITSFAPSLQIRAKKAYIILYESQLSNLPTR
ncbi:MAG: hypothetical protein WC250_01385 [Candidatus Paceibacterota bacterium]|jgi:hypothetical protein